RSVFDPIVVATPGSEAWDFLKAFAHRGLVRLVPVDMGVHASEAPVNRVRDGVRFTRADAQLAALVVRERVDVIHTLDRTRAALLAVLAARSLGRGLVWHAEVPWTGWAARIIGAADCVIAASHYIADEYQRHGVRGDRLRMI